MDPIRLLQTLGASLAAGEALELTSDYDVKTALLAAACLGMAAEDLDRLVERLGEENAALRALLGRAAQRLGASASLAERLRARAALPPVRPRISELRRENAELRTLLIELHAAVEEIEGGAARELEREIWAELRRSNERRRLASAPL